MEYTEELKRQLIKDGHLNEEQLLQAEDYADTRKISMEGSLVFLDLLDYETLGRALSSISGLPYAPLLKSSPGDAAKAMVPAALAERRRIFPVSYKNNVLSIAAADSPDPSVRRDLEALFPPPTKLRLFVSSVTEIEEAISVHYKGKTVDSRQELKVPEHFASLIAEHNFKERPRQGRKGGEERAVVVLEPDFARGRALKTILRAEGYEDVEWAGTPGAVTTLLKERPRGLLLANGLAFPHGGAWLQQIPDDIDMPPVSCYHLSGLVRGDHYNYEQMNEALISMVSFFVRRSVVQAPKRLKKILARVRWCRLLALRLRLPPLQVDAVTLSAWLSALEYAQELVRHVKTPYPLKSIMTGLSDGKKAAGIEGAILHVVTRYQDLEADDPEAAWNLNGLRRHLSGQLASFHGREVLEAFLNLVRDEDFLEAVDGAGGRILVVDPDQAGDSPEVLRLVNDGYDVRLASDARKALEIVARSGVDLVISETKLPDRDGLALCRALKEDKGTTRVGVLFLTSAEGKGLQARCLSAGADDFLNKPADLDVLSLKVERALAFRSAKKPSRGVHGSLSEMSPIDFIQILTTGEKNTEIRIKGPEGEGRIYIRGGDIVHAETGSLRGEKAFFRLISWNEGEFQIVPCERFPQRTIHGGAMSLMMEGARLIDEEGESQDS